MKVTWTRIGTGSQPKPNPVEATEDIRERTTVVETLPVLGALALTLIAASLTPLSGQDGPATDSSEKKTNENLPLEAARSFHLDTDEGSWISLDVSPDGETIVFDYLGDLFTLPLTGGTATRITEGMAFDAQPRYSPDGSKVVFISDRSGGENVWTLELATGDSAQITKGNGNSYLSPTFTPDGEYIFASKAAARLGIAKLWMGHVDGGSGTTLFEEPATLKTVGAALSPDGRWVWAAQRQRSWDYNAQFPQYQIVMYDRETGESYSRTARYGSAFRPTLSPDGQWLVYGTRFEDQTGLRIRNLDTGDEEWLKYPVQRDDQESIADRDVLPGMAFTPDSRELVASYGGKIWRIPVDGSDPVAVPFRVNEDFAIGPEVAFEYDVSDDPEFTIRQIRDARPSPDGNRLAFTALNRLYVMDFPGGEPRALVEGDFTQAHPTWSPDGEWIAYVTWDEDEGGSVSKVRARGGNPVRLTDRPATYQYPAWSPDGQRIVAVRGPARAYQEATGPFAPGVSDDLVWFAANGGPSTQIAPTGGRTFPHFTTSSDRIYLYHNTKGLLSIRWDGTDEKAHLKVTGGTRPGQTQPDRASWVMISPDGGQALAAVHADLYLVTIPRIGGEAPTVSVANPEAAAFPAKRLTDIGGQFPFWGADGETIHWSIGNAHVVYNLADAEAFVAAQEEEEAGAEGGEVEIDEESPDDEADSDESDDEPETYEPEEHRVLLSAQRDIPEGIVVLQGARILTMEGDEVIESGDIVVTNNRITAVGASGSVAFPSGAEVIDVSGMTITPGFVDTHAHMWPWWNLHKNQVWMYVANLAYGVTTTRDPQTSSTDVITYGDMVDAGEMLGPRVYSTGPGIFGDYVTDAIRDYEHAQKIMRRYSEYYDTKTVKMYMAGNRQQRQWVIKAAREQNIMPTTEGGLKFMYNLTMMIDGYSGQEHSFPVYPVYEDVVTLTKEAGTAYTPTLLVSYGGPWAENYFYSRENPYDDPKLSHFTPYAELAQKSRRRPGWFRDEEHVFDDHAVGAKDIIEAGGRVGVGSHGQLQGLGYHWELWAIQSGGMTEYDALRAATILGAEALGLGAELGSVTNGKLADLVILEDNPLDDIRATNSIRYVMKNGRLYDGDTMDQVWPEARPLERRNWVAPEPGVKGGPEN